MEGQDFSLTCEVGGTEMLAINSTSYRWDRVGGTVGLSRTAVLSFHPAVRDDGGEYRCTIDIISPSIPDPYTVTSTSHISITRKSKIT